jgi:hypothetical protein
MNLPKHLEQLPWDTIFAKLEKELGGRRLKWKEKTKSWELTSKEPIKIKFGHHDLTYLYQIKYGAKKVYSNK